MSDHSLDKKLQNFCLAFLLLFCFIFAARIVWADDGPHDAYWCQGGYAGGNSTQCNEEAWHRDCCDHRNQEPVQKMEFQVKRWQQCTVGKTSSEHYITGYCNINCLEDPKNPRYYDDPVKPGTQKEGNNVKNVTLPVVLAWKDVAGFGDNSAQWASHPFSSSPLAPVVKRSENRGPTSYRIQIWDDSPSGIDNINLWGKRLSSNPEVGLVDSGIEAGVDGKQAFYAVLSRSGAQYGFNSRDHGNICFFNATDTYHWRVKACCYSNGTVCKDYKETWTFTADSSPELKKPLDPDWNGTNPTANISFKDISPTKKDYLNWCPAKLPAAYQIKNRSTQYANSYKLTVTSSEANEFTNKLKNMVSWLGSLIGLGSAPSAPKQDIHSLSIINGDLVYNILPSGYIDPKSDNKVETVFPAQGRGDLAFFSSDKTYSWKLQSCPDENTTRCDDLNKMGYANSSQEWKIKTIKESVDPPEALSPKDDPAGDNPVGFPISITWSIPAGANSFRFKTNIPNFPSLIKTTWSTVPNNETDDAARKLFTLENAGIKLDTTYTWSVRACAEFDSESGCDDASQSRDFSFRTTGRPPKKESMLPDMDSTINFPQNFTWEKVPGARSYNIELYDSGNKKVGSKLVKFGPDDAGQPGAQFDYPYIMPAPDNTSAVTYTWKVQTCADENGEHCGQLWSEPQYFVVKRPGFPTIKSNATPIGSLRDANLEWEGQTKHYWITISYNKPQPLTQPDCDLANPVVTKNWDNDSCSLQNDCIPSGINLACAGTYQWKIQPCANPNCSDRGEDNAAAGNFTIKAGAGDANAISVCGQAFDNPSTEWNETERCEIKHFFLLAKVVIDYLLFKASLLLLPILVLITGIFFYLAKEGPNTLKYIKDAWIRIGIGYAVIFMAWLLTSWLMLIVGYDKIWWKIL